MSSSLEFPFEILASLLVWLFVVRMVLDRSRFQRHLLEILILGAVLIVVGMYLGRHGAQIGLPWWIYYPLPALLTLIVPPMILKMNRKETVRFVILIWIASLSIHFLFSFFLGWKNYMPFIRISSLWEILK